MADNLNPTSSQHHGEIQQIKDSCNKTTNPHDVEKQEELAREVESIVDRLGLDLSDPVNAFPGPFNPFFTACQNGNLPIIKLFLKRGASLNIFDEFGRSPLVLAIASSANDHNTISRLLDMGAKINFGTEGKTPLMTAFYNMKREITTLLLRRGADVNDVNLPAFIFVEAVFCMHSNIVMMAAGYKLQLTSFLELVALSTEIILAGLRNRTLCLNAKSLMHSGFTRGELATLWKFQHLCMVLNFRIEKHSLDNAIKEIQDTIDDDADEPKVEGWTEWLKRLKWMKDFQSRPLPLTYFCRIAIRSHLADPCIGGETHLSAKIDSLPLPKVCLEFLNMKQTDIKNIQKYMTI